MPEAKITRQEVVVVGTVSHNEYGDLLFTDKAGKEYKVGVKRAKYFEEVIIPARAVQLNFSTAYNKEYIYNANLVHLSPEEEPAQFAKPEPIVTQKVVPPKVTPKPPAPLNKEPSKVGDREADIHRQVAFKGVIELVSHGILNIDDWQIWSNNFTRYLDGE